MSDSLVIRGAREHNLKNIDLTLPRDELIVFTGLSGSGKSSLAFDTIYAEGQRRYVESLSAYARQFLGQMDKPDVDFIEGLSPAISIDQKAASRNPRSTVGTITEIYDYLRLLYARIGVPHCPECGREITRQTPQQIVDRILELDDGTRFQVLAPVVRGRKGRYDGMLAELAQQGFTRARVDGDVIDLSAVKGEAPELERYEQHTIEVVVDRLVRKKGIERRLADSLETALTLAEGVAEIEVVPRGADDDSEPELLTFSEHLACDHCGISFEELAPRNFSFNSPYGACEHCDGLGTRYEVDPELVVPDEDLSLDDGAIAPWAGFRGEYFSRVLASLSDEEGFSTEKPWKRLAKKAKKTILYGAGDKKIKVRYKNRYGRVRQYSSRYEGVIRWLERRHDEVESERTREQIEGYMRSVPCPECGGARLNPASLAVTIGGRGIHEVGDMSIRGTAEFFAEIELTERESIIAERVLKEVNERLRFLLDVGPRLPGPQPVVGHAGGWRGAADPARVTGRQRAGRSALRPRRTVDRVAPARQPAPHRHAHPPPLAGKHRHRGRTRRGDDPCRRPRRRHRAGRRGARRRDRGGRFRRRRHGDVRLDHGPVPVG